MIASEAAGRAEALRRIAACHAAQAEELDLGGLRLTALDGELLAALCQLGWLRRLFLGPSAEGRAQPELAYEVERNALGALPGALFDALTGLEQLDLALNQLRDLPASIANLAALTSLDLSFNLIGDEGAQALEGLVNLASLSLFNSDIGAEGRRRSRASSSSPASSWGATTSGTRGRRRSRASSTSTASSCGATTSGPRGRRRSRASSTSPVSTCRATAALGPRGRKRSRAWSTSPASTCPATTSGPRGRRRSRP